MPQLADPNFNRAVVLLCDHGPDGAFGLIVNRPTDTPAIDAVRFEPPLLSTSPLHLWEGGPVEPQRGWILMSERPDHSDVVEVHDGVYLSTSPMVLRGILEMDPPPRARVLTGYAGWGPGQLDAELSDSAWLISEVDVNLLFEITPDQMWETAIRRLGADPFSLQMGHGVH
jgi:putative transcriptional regulator